MPGRLATRSYICFLLQCDVFPHWDCWRLKVGIIYLHTHSCHLSAVLLYCLAVFNEYIVRRSFQNVGGFWAAKWNWQSLGGNERRCLCHCSAKVNQPWSLNHPLDSWLGASLDYDLHQDTHLKPSVCSLISSQYENIPGADSEQVHKARWLCLWTVQEIFHLTADFLPSLFPQWTTPPPGLLSAFVFVFLAGYCSVAMLVLN